MHNSKAIRILGYIALLTAVFIYLYIGIFMHGNNKVPLITQELLFGDEQYLTPQLSPNGKQIAFLAPHKEVMNIWVCPSDSIVDAHVVTQNTDRGIFTYWWGYDNRSLFYTQNNNGDENWNIYHVDLVTQHINNLTPFPDVQVRLVHYSKEFPTDMLISMNKENKSLRDVYQINIPTGSLKLIAKNPGNNAGWKADDDLQVRLSFIMHPDGGFSLLHRRDNEAPWHEIFRCDADIVSQACTCVGFGEKKDELYMVDGTDNNTARLIKLNITTKQKDILASDPAYDIYPTLHMHPQTNQPAWGLVQREDLEIITLDETYAQDFILLKQYKSCPFNIISYDNAFTSWIVRFSNSDYPCEYYLYNRVAKKIRFLFAEHPELSQYPLAKTKAFQFVARDGLNIHGYLTYPTTTHSYKNLPAVVYVHGGPSLRDTMHGCDPIVQLLANRGYACIQINYRGSTGYGKAFAKAGNKEWGNAMQHDLTDSILWLAHQGIVDPQRIAILGGSYGGYAALAGAAFTPDVYCCAIDLCGMSNLITFIESIPPYWKPLLAQTKQRIGDIDTERTLLEKRSPFFHVNNIHIPLLIAHGANDPRVKQAESEQMVAALKERGIACEYLLFKDEGHGLARPCNRLTFYKAVEQFLAEHLGGRYER